MSGHSKWSKIKRKKGANDSKRSKIFSKIIKEITVAVKESGPEQDSNPRLRVAIANAKGQSMPKDTIQRAINKGKDKNSANYNEVTYEGYAPHGVALFIECSTDNLQRTVSNIRAIFNKYNGSLGKNGCLSFLFDRKGFFTLLKGDFDIEELELEAIDGGAEDFEIEDDMISITTAMEDFGNMMKKLDELNIEPKSAELMRIPTSIKAIAHSDALKVLKIIEIFEDDDDVKNVYHNLELTNELIEEM